MRSAVAQANQARNQAIGTAGTLEGRATDINSTLVPGLEREANNPTGFTPEELNNQLVAGEQGAGGANAGIAGEAGLRMARTRNSAGYSNVLDEAARDKTKQLSENALNVQNENAKLAQEKQSQARKMLAGLYGTDVSGNLEAQGLETKDIEAEAQAGQSGWFQNMTGLLKSLQGAGASKGPSGWSVSG
jgi:hypothetical protein